MEYSKSKIISSSQLKKLSAEMFKKKPENEQQNVLKYEIGNNAKNLLKKKYTFSWDQPVSNMWKR